MNLRLATALLSMTFAIVACAGAAHAAAPEAVDVVRVPDDGVQPQALADAKGAIHLIYLKGDPAKCDVFYVRSTDGGKRWTPPIRVNSQPGSAIAVGTVRGAHLALGKGGRVHVAWMGSQTAEPKVAGKAAPMLYARLANSGKAFEPQRNVITEHVGLDGGGSIAADDTGNVYIAWHAPTEKGAGEADRRVWLAHSTDDGKVFAAEVPMSPDPTGACGCCGMRLFVNNGRVEALYRSATEQVHRDIYLLAAPMTIGGAGADPAPAAAKATVQKISPMESGKCMMSTASAGTGAKGTAVAWENDGQIEFGLVDAKTGTIDRPHPVPGKAGARKHPAIAVGTDGLLIAWAEGTGWNKGGTVMWQRFDPTGEPFPLSVSFRDGLPAWSLPAVVARPDGTFLLIY